ncbi:hypothetical protein DSCO28_24320 [Desulfosarcina ovata subsp. sediminis]|uniref:histidine kinase n=1 Tax=Desulfosarcina ovata subsp. sediminis TaxID=885957 RepID=A0A5K7ZLC4_9BACT|nr:response regulator [Desulfosarcina ovata]BBO81866.1 hypothetical protein DSCO28_24320 [Desulfosarcina ovata subsp. sediminis]
MNADNSARSGQEQTRKLLIVDDEKDFVLSLEDILETRDYIVAKAHSQEEACDTIRYFDAQVVLLDIRLGRANGINLIAKLKRIRPTVVCVMMTAYADTDTAIRALQEGAYDYLKKPLAPDELFATLNRAFEKIQLENEKTAVEQALRNQNRELEKINNRLRQIVAATQGFAACSCMEEIGPLLLKEFAQNMAADGGSLFLRDEDGLVLVHSLDPDHTPSSIAFPLRAGSVFEKAIRSGKPVVVSDIREEQDVTGSSWQGYRDGSLLVFPLTEEKGEIVGIISLHNKVPPPFTLQDKELGSILASYSSETLRAARALEALQESKERLNAIMDSVNTGILVIDEATHRITDANSAALNMIGVSKEELVGTAHEAYVRPVAKAATSISGPGLDSVSTERIVRKADGRELPILRTANRVMLGGREHIVESFIDITKRIQLQSQLQQAQKMEAIGTLAGGIAHDFNNLLQAVLGYTQVLLFNIEKEDPAFANLKGIEKAGMRAAELTRQLLTYSRKVESRLRPVDLNHEIVQVRKLLDRTIPKMIDIELALCDTLNIVNADPTQMEQVLVNLAINARDSMNDGGKLTIQTDNVVLSEAFCRTHLDANPGAYVMFSVSDTGHGMNKEIADHMFEPFYTTKGSGKGTGLGLAMVYGIVKNHCGHITCDSKVGSGTTFNIYLPAIEGIVGEQPGDGPATISFCGDETILLVDDEPAIRDFGEQMLSRYGYKVVTAADGESALALYEKMIPRISLVVLDMFMPGMGGQWCLEKLVGMNTGVKVLIASGYATDEARKKAMAAGACGFVDKPYEVATLLKAVQRTINDQGIVR